MTVLWIVLPLALAMAGAGVVAFVWAVRSGQFDDLETPGARAVIDGDDSPAPATPLRSRPAVRPDHRP